MHVSCNTLASDGAPGCLDLLFILDARETVAISLLKGGVLITCLPGYYLSASTLCSHDFVNIVCKRCSPQLLTHFLL